MWFKYYLELSFNAVQNSFNKLNSLIISDNFKFNSPFSPIIGEISLRQRGGGLERM